MKIDNIEVGSFAVCVHQVPEYLRIVSWNINRGSNLPAVADFLSSLDADVILLQEVDKHARRTGGADVAWEISRILRMNYAFGIEFEELSQSFGASPAFHGQATLSRWPIAKTKVFRFQNQTNFWKPTWWIPQVGFTQRRMGGRIALSSTITVGPMRLVTYNVHLESRGSNSLRSRQIEELFREVSKGKADSPVVVAGDFNCDLRTPDVTHQIEGHQLHLAITRNMLSAETVTTRGNQAIDFILTGDSVQVLATEVHTTIDASDHYPVSAIFRFRQAPMSMAATDPTFRRTESS